MRKVYTAAQFWWARRTLAVSKVSKIATVEDLGQRTQPLKLSACVAWKLQFTADNVAKGVGFGPFPALSNYSSGTSSRTLRGGSRHRPLEKQLKTSAQLLGRKCLDADRRAARRREPITKDDQEACGTVLRYSDIAAKAICMAVRSACGFNKTPTFSAKAG